MWEGDRGKRGWGGKKRKGGKGEKKKGGRKRKSGDNEREYLPQGLRE